MKYSDSLFKYQFNHKLHYEELMYFLASHEFIGGQCVDVVPRSSAEVLTRERERERERESGAAGLPHR